MMAHGSSAKVDPHSWSSANHDLELDKLSNDHEDTSYRDNEDDSLLQENEVKDIGNGWLNSGHTNGKQTSFWMAVNIVATILIVSHAYLPFAQNITHDE